MPQKPSFNQFRPPRPVGAEPRGTPDPPADLDRIARQRRQFRPTARASNAVGAARHAVANTPHGRRIRVRHLPGGRREDPLALRPPVSSPENSRRQPGGVDANPIRAPRIRDTALAARDAGDQPNDRGRHAELGIPRSTGIRHPADSRRPRRACGARHPEIDWNPPPDGRPTPGRPADARRADGSHGRRRHLHANRGSRIASPPRDPPRRVAPAGGHRPDRTDSTRVPRETAQPRDGEPNPGSRNNLGAKAEFRRRISCTPPPPGVSSR